MIIIEKDKHLRRDEPFFNAHKDYFDWLIHQSFNTEDNTFISLGDFFHTAHPTPDEIDLAISALGKLRFKKIYILVGNHCYSSLLKTYSVLPLANNPKVVIISNPCQIKIEDKTFLFLPFYKDELFDLPSMKEYYSSLPEELQTNDYICHHIEDETVSFGKKNTGIDLSYLTGKRIGGHIHKSLPNYEIGMPVLSRSDERGEQSTLMVIDGNKEFFIPIPKLIDYYDVIYGEKLPEVEAKYPLWDIIDAPSYKQARTFYREKNPSIRIHAIKLADEKEEAIKAETSVTGITIADHFENYIEERTDLPEWAISKLRDIVTI
jgi:hypothetical protein